MHFRPVFILAVGLVLAACSGPLPAPAGGMAEGVTPAPTVTAPTVASAEPPTLTPQPSPVPPTQPPTRTVEPPLAAPTVAPSPMPTSAPVDLRAWAIAPSGDFFMLDRVGVVHQGFPDAVGPEGGGFGAPDMGRGYLAVSDAFVVESSVGVTRTIVLQRPALNVRADYPGGGPLAVDGAKRFYVLYNDAVWSYKLDDLSRPPTPVTTWPVDAFTPRPRNLAIDQPSRQLIVTLEDVSASPPHRQQWYQAYNLDSLQPTVRFAGGLGALTPASAGASGIVAGLAAKNGLLGSKVTVYDRQGKELRAAERFDGRPVADPVGDYLYVLRERGVWVLRASDLGLVAFEPFTGKPPTDLLVSPDGSKLYLVSDEAVSVRDTAQMRAAGIAPLHGPLPAGWFYPALPLYAAGARFFPVTQEVAFVQVGGYGETWRTVDGGRTWAMLPGLVYPNFHYSTHLSISPDFALGPNGAGDGTLVAITYGETPQYLRSTDRGDTWTPYDPPVAFVSDRDGGLNVYTAERGKPEGGSARNVLRRTFSGTGNQLPAWSPGWTRFAYQSNVNGNSKIFTQRADCAAGGECDVRQITDGPGDDTLPAWAPDGRWVAFVSTRDGTPQIYVVPVNGGPAHQLTSGAGSSWRPAWLPDSRSFVYTTTGENGSNDIYSADLAEGPDGKLSLRGIAVPMITHQGDDRDVAVTRNAFVYLSNNDTGIMRTYLRYNYRYASSQPVTPGTEPEGHPAPLDDDRGTVLLTLEREGGTGIYRATSDGYEPFVVDATFDGQPAAGPVPWQPGPDWSRERATAWQR